MPAGIELTEGRFRAMGSDCRIVTDLDDRAVGFAVHRLEDLESRWSRFRTDSEITRCNLHAGQWVEVSAATAELVSRAVSAFERTRGRFHPLMLRELAELGYDRSHEMLDPPSGTPMRSGRRRRRTVEESISIDGRGIRIPPGAAFDPGGLGKGLAADIVVTALVEAGAEWAFLSVGADLRVAGSAIEERGWQVDVENPWKPGRTWASARMRSGGLSSSSVGSRRWLHGRTDAHHLLDPNTGRPVAGDRIAATVHATDAWWADVVAKCVVIDVSVDASTLDSWDAMGIAFGVDGGHEELGWQANRAFAVAS